MMVEFPLPNFGAVENIFTVLGIRGPIQAIIYLGHLALVLMWILDWRPGGGGD